MTGWDSDPKRWGHYEDDDDEPPPTPRHDPAPEGDKPRSGGKPAPESDDEPIDPAWEISYLNHPAPTEGEATDYTNSVTLHIDTDRRPLRLLLRENWRDRLPPQMLGHTIMQLYGKALDEQKAKAKTYLRQHPEAVAGDTQTASTPESSDPPRSESSFLDSFHTALEKFESLKQEIPKLPPEEPAPKPAPQTFSFMFSGNWMASCEVNADWAQRSAASAIMTEFSRTLQEAKERGEAEPETDSPAQRLSRQLMDTSKELMSIGNEAIAQLRWMTRQ